MRFPTPLIVGTLVRRYKRFLADVALADGTVVTVHCANPGAMLGVNTPGLKVWLRDHRLGSGAGTTRKLAWSWEIVEAEGTLIGVNTALPNRLVEEALAAGTIAELAGYGPARREVRYGKASRVDFLLEAPDRPRCFVEVKNVHLKRDGRAEFPDSVTARGAKHMRELADQVKAGDRAVVLFVVQRDDCASFAPAADIDPVYAAAFRAARAGGVEALCYGCKVSPDTIELDRAMRVEP
jgi:sugar fermentation stimulation protein A